MLPMAARTNFNSRPSARGDQAIRGLAPVSDISIHAPPRGATRLVQHMESSVTISIHAPPRGATAGAWRLLGVLEPHFNSRPSARGDYRLELDSFAGLFQFTPLREGRRVSRGVLAHFHFYFNSRPSARGDPRLYGAGCIGVISIHAPPRGATLSGHINTARTLFQFTPLREGRPDERCNSGKHGISIHAPPRGATAKDMQFLQIFCSTLTNQHGLTIVPRNLSRLFW